MQSNIDSLFNNIEKETTNELDVMVNNLNNYIAKLRGAFFNTKPNPSKKKDDIEKLRKVARIILKTETEYDYKDFVRFAIRTTKPTKYEQFPTIKKIASKSNVWQTAIGSKELPMHLFNPITVPFNGIILNKKLNTYFGFNIKGLNEYFTTSSAYSLLVDKVIKPILRNKPPETISFEDLNSLEWATACAIKWRHKTNLSKTLYLVWKKAKEIPRRK